MPLYFNINGQTPNGFLPKHHLVSQQTVCFVPSLGYPTSVLCSDHNIHVLVLFDQFDRLSHPFIAARNHCLYVYRHTDIQHPIQHPPLTAIDV